MAKRKVWKNLDYLTVSFRQQLPDEVMLPKGKGFEIAETMKPMQHYDKVSRLENGAVLFESASQAQGARLDMGGQVLQHLRDDSWGDFFQLAYWYHHPQRINLTRVDYAVTIGGVGSPEQCLNEFDKGRAKTRIKSVKNDDRRRGNNGRTVRWGGEKADIWVSVYDKGTERPDLRELYDIVCRVELRCKAPHANNMARDMLELGLNDAGDNWLKSKLDFPNLRWYQWALAAPALPIEGGRKKEDKFWSYAATFLTWVEKRYEAGEHEAVSEWFSKAYDLQQKINGR